MSKPLDNNYTDGRPCFKYRYIFGKTAEDEINRIISSRFDKSISKLNNHTNCADDSNHEMRKNMKKVRAALRLVRGTISDKAYKIRNIAARDIARLGSELRESRVLISTFDNLEYSCEQELDNSSYKIIRERLVNEYQKLRIKLLEDEELLMKITQQLEMAKPGMKIPHLNETGFDAFEKGLKKVYKRGRKAAEAARKEPTIENYHEWRKRAKYLRYQLRILKDSWPPVLNGFIKELHCLSDLLGADHDLAILEEKLKEISRNSDSIENAEQWIKRIESLKSEKQNSIQHLGEKIYAEKPKVFVNRVGIYFNTEK